MCDIYIYTYMHMLYTLRCHRLHGLLENPPYFEGFPTKPAMMVKSARSFWEVTLSGPTFLLKISKTSMASGVIANINDPIFSAAMAHVWDQVLLLPSVGAQGLASLKGFPTAALKTALMTFLLGSRDPWDPFVGPQLSVNS